MGRREFLLTAGIGGFVGLLMAAMAITGGRGGARQRRQRDEERARVGLPPEPRVRGGWKPFAAFGALGAFLGPAGLGAARLDAVIQQALEERHAPLVGRLAYQVARLAVVLALLLLLLIGGMVAIDVAAAEGPATGTLLLTGGEFGAGVIDRFVTLTGKDRGGVIGGNSAGAIVAGFLIVRGRPDKPVLMARDHSRGFGFLHDGVVTPHLTEAKQ